MEENMNATLVEAYIGDGLPDGADPKEFSPVEDLPDATVSALAGTEISNETDCTDFPYDVDGLFDDSDRMPVDEPADQDKPLDEPVGQDEEPSQDEPIRPDVQEVLVFENEELAQKLDNTDAYRVVTFDEIDSQDVCSGMRVILLPCSERGYTVGVKKAIALMPIAKSVKVLRPVDENYSEFLSNCDNLSNSEFENRLCEIYHSTGEFPEGNMVSENEYIYFSDSGGYTKGPKSKRIADFVPFPVVYIKDNNGDYFITAIITNTQVYYPVKIPLAAFVSKSSFKDILLPFPVSFNGNEQHLTYIKNFLLKSYYEVKHSVYFVGMHHVDDRFYFVDSKGSINSEGIEDDRLVLAEQGNVFTTDILSYECATGSEVATVLKSLFGFNSTKITAALIAWVTMAYFNEHLKQLGLNICIPWLIGEAGSGKNETGQQVILNLFALPTQGYILGADKTTEASLNHLASWSNIFPMLVDEVKPAQLKKETIRIISALVRNSYNNNTATRSMSNQKLARHTYRNPVIFLGEEALLGETSNRERSLELRFSKDALENNKNNMKNHFKILTDNKEILNKLGRAILAYALKTDTRRVSEIFHKQRNLVVGRNLKMHDRVVNSAAIVITGLVLFNDMLEELGVSLGQYGLNMSNLVDAVLSNFDDDFTRNGQGVIESTIETFDLMASQGLLTYGVDFRVISTRDSKKCLILNIKPFYEKFLKFIKESHVQEDYITSYREFHKQLQQKKFFVRYSKQRMNDRTNNEVYAENLERPTPCFHLDIEMLVGMIDVPTFKYHYDMLSPSTART